MLTSWGVKLLDFGIAWDSTDQAEAIAAGSGHYQSPEQLRGNPDGRSDIFSFGQVLLDMFGGTGAPESPDRRRNVPGDVLAIISRCTAVSPSERYASVTSISSTRWRMS
jgi:serine/threonine protein kinase